MVWGFCDRHQADEALFPPDLLKRGETHQGKRGGDGQHRRGAGGASCATRRWELSLSPLGQSMSCVPIGKGYTVRVGPSEDRNGCPTCPVKLS